MREFGLPAHLTRSRDAQAMFLLNNGRTFMIGILIWTFYLRADYRVVDMVFRVVGSVLGVTDAAVVWREGMRSRALFRLCSSWLLAGWGGRT